MVDDVRAEVGAEVPANSSAMSEPAQPSVSPAAPPKTTTRSAQPDSAASSGSGSTPPTTTSRQRPAKARTAASEPMAPAELDTSIPALLIRLDWNPAHHATLGVIRSLGRAGVPVHAILEGDRVPAARSRYLTRIHPWIKATDDPAALVDHLCRLAEQIGGQPVLFPMDDAGALLLAEHGARLTEFARFPAVGPGLPARVADKEQLVGLCRESGVGYPETRVPARAEDVAAMAAELGLPLIAKWAKPWLLPQGSGLRSTCVVDTAEQAQQLFARRGVAGCALLLQRRIAGTPGGDRFFHGYFTRAAGSGGAVGALADGPVVCRFGATGRKDLSWPRAAGLTARGTWLPDPQLEQAACRVVRAAGFTGVVDLDFRFDPATGQYALLDFNPRLGAQFRLFTDPAGLDLPRAVHLDLSGRPVPAPTARPGRRLTVETYDPFVGLRLARDVERSWFARDDPAPFPAALLHSGARLVRRLGPDRRPSIQEGNAS